MNHSGHLQSYLLKAEYFKIFLISQAFWWGLYFFIHFFMRFKLHKSKKDELDSKNRLVSIIHGIYCILFSFMDYFYYNRDVCGDTNSEFQNINLIISGSYFFYDVIACSVFGIQNIQMFLHHLTVVIGIYAGVLYNNSATEFIRGIAISEVTNPVMHTREIVKNMGLKHTKIYLLMDISYMIIYIISRQGLGVFLWIFTFFCNGNLLFVKFTGSFIFFQSVWFSKRMFGIFKYRYREYLERSKHKIQMYWFKPNKQIEEMEFYKSRKLKYVP